MSLTQFFEASAASYNCLLGAYVFVMTFSGRRYIGQLVSYDASGKVVLQDARDRLITGTMFTDVVLGNLVIKPEEIVFVGRMNADMLAQPAGLTRVEAGKMLEG